MAKKKKTDKPTYSRHENAVCISVYDLQGAPIPDSVADKVEQAVFEVTQNEKLAISLART